MRHRHELVWFNRQYERYVRGLLRAQLSNDNVNANTQQTDPVYIMLGVIGTRRVVLK